MFSYVLLLIVLFHTQESFHRDGSLGPTWFPMGGFNECPLPEEQVAIFKYWYEKYGAAPALVTHDVWELYVENPPNTQEEAESLAWEQYGFCSDIVWQGIGTVNGLAGTLIHSSVWYFWWD